MSTTTTKTPEASIKLRQAYVKGARKKFGIKPTYEAWDGKRSGSIHQLSAACKIVRIGPDEIAVTDGNGGYTPFGISVLKDILKQASRLPITTEFRCDA